MLPRTGLAVQPMATLFAVAGLMGLVAHLLGTAVIRQLTVESAVRVDLVIELLDRVHRVVQA